MSSENGMLNFEVLQDEVQLYLLGTINKDELLLLVNKKREEKGIKNSLIEIPKFFDKLLEIAVVGLNMYIKESEKTIKNW